MKKPEEAPEATQPKKHPREITSAIAGMSKRRLALIAKRDKLNEEIALLDASLLPWMGE